MGFLSLSRRAKLINEKHGLTLSAAALRALYHRNGVRFARARVRPERRGYWTVLSERSRIAFALKLRHLQDAGAGDRLIYVSETTFEPHEIDPSVRTCNQELAARLYEG